MTKKLRIAQFFVRINPDKIKDFRQPKGQITLMRNLGLIILTNSAQILGSRNLSAHYATIEVQYLSPAIHCHKLLISREL